jgi:excisionase family DNA binding protein
VNAQGPSTPALSDGQPLLLTPAEAAERLRLRESWLRRKAAGRQIPSTRLGKHLRFSAADLAAIVAMFDRPADPASAPAKRGRPTT